MSATFSTSITIEGTKIELYDCIKSLCDFQKNKGFDLSVIEIKGKSSSINYKTTDIKKFFEENLVDSKGQICVYADGPYGRFCELKEVRLFEYLAEVVPFVYFKGLTSGFSNHGDQWIEGELKAGKLYLSGTNIEAEDFDEDEENGQYIRFIKKELPYSNFCKLFNINKKAFPENHYDDFINDMMDESLSELDYDTFMSYGFGELEEDEFYEVMDKISDLKLITFNEFMWEYFDENCGSSIMVYDPIKKDYLNDLNCDDYDDEEFECSDDEEDEDYDEDEYYEDEE